MLVKCQYSTRYLIEVIGIVVVPILERLPFLYLLKKSFLVGQDIVGFYPLKPPQRQ